MTETITPTQTGSAARAVAAYKIYGSGEAEVHLAWHDFSAEPDPEAASAAWVSQQFWRPLTPSDFPLCRFALAKLGPADFVWVQTYHHLIIDATRRRYVEAYERLHRILILVELVPDHAHVRRGAVRAGQAVEQP